MKMYNNYERLPRNYSLLTDEYEFSMANAYLNANKQEEIAVFDLFFRKIPNGGGYAIMAGLDKVIEYVKNFQITPREINYLERKGYSQAFIDYMKNFKFTGDLYAIPDGTPVFPNEPLITIKAPIIEAQIMETMLLTIVNGAMEHATGARRIIEATPRNVKVMEFGSRRADGQEASIDSALYGVMAGCCGTSNTMAADMLGQTALGTMAHSWIESFDSELEAFTTYAEIYPNNCILLVDTFDTLKSGVPNAIKTFKYMQEKGMNTDNIGIRIDSGDLTYLSKEARKMMDEAGFTNATICLSNGLTAEVIESLTNQGAVFDSLGVGDNISKPAGRMGCVYKEVALNKNGEYIPKIKLSNDTIKIVNPDYKKIYRAFDKETGYAIADVMTRHNEPIEKEDMKIVCPTDSLKNKQITGYELVELQKPIFLNGKLVYNDPDIMQKKAYCEEQMQKLYPEVRRTLMPHEYYVDGTEEYVNFKNELIGKVRSLVR